MFVEQMTLWTCPSVLPKSSSRICGNRSKQFSNKSYPCLNRPAENSTLACFLRESTCCAMLLKTRLARWVSSTSFWPGASSIKLTRLFVLLEPDLWLWSNFCEWKVRLFVICCRLTTFFNLSILLKSDDSCFVVNGCSGLYASAPSTSNGLCGTDGLATLCDTEWGLPIYCKGSISLSSAGSSTIIYLSFTGIRSSPSDYCYSIFYS